MNLCEYNKNYHIPPNIPKGISKYMCYPTFMSFKTNLKRKIRQSKCQNTIKMINIQSLKKQPQQLNQPMIKPTRLQVRKSTSEDMDHPVHPFSLMKDLIISTMKNLWSIEKSHKSEGSGKSARRHRLI